MTPLRILLTLVLLTLLLLCASVQAADRKLAWDDPQQGMTYNVAELVAGNPVPIGTTVDREFQLKGITPGPHTYVVTVSNGQAESLPSDVTLPGGVVNLRVVATISLEIK